MAKELTDVKFWDEYWKGCRLPSAIDEDFSFDRCLAKELRRRLTGLSGEALEVGCAPGRWMALLHELGIVPSGIEYSRAGVDITVRNLNMLHVKYGKILCGDFLSIRPDRLFDVVMSLGFIEHFDAPDAVLARHLEWLRPGGTLVIGVPNLRGVYGVIQSALDKSVLEKHNTGVMSLGYFKKAATFFRLDIRFIGYIGSFEPALPLTTRGWNGAAASVIKLFLAVMRRIRNIRVLDSVNSRFFSSYILAVYTKKAPE